MVEFTEPEASMLPLRLLEFGPKSDGAAALEFAILAPVFLLFASGLLAYGIYFGAAQSVEQLAADAARTSIAGLTNTERATLVGNFLANNAGSYLLIDPEAVHYTVGPQPSDATEYRVTLNYDASNLPIWNLYVPLPLPSRTISYASVIRLGGT